MRAFVRRLLHALRDGIANVWAAARTVAAVFADPSAVPIMTKNERPARLHFFPVI